MSGGFVPDPRVLNPRVRNAAVEDMRAIVENMQANRASELGDRIYEKIQDYDAKLGDTQEVGVRLVSFGQTVVFRLVWIECINPSLVCFVGTTDDGKPVELIQHVTQISILLTTVPRQDLSKPKIPPGFGRRPEETEEEDQKEGMEEEDK
jgi:hypothetical protein